MRFFWKNDLGKIFIIPKGFIASPIDVLCSKVVKFGRREIGKIVRCLLDKKFASLSSSRYCTDRAQNLSDTVLGVLQLSSISVHFTFGRVISERVNTVRSRAKLNPIFG